MSSQFSIQLKFSRGLIFLGLKNLRGKIQSISIFHAVKKRKKTLK